MSKQAREQLTSNVMEVQLGIVLEALCVVAKNQNACALWQSVLQEIFNPTRSGFCVCPGFDGVTVESMYSNNATQHRSAMMSRK